MATLEEIGSALKNAHAAGDVEGARKLAQAYQQMQGATASEPEQAQVERKIPNRFGDESAILNAMKGMSARGKEIVSAVAPSIVSPEQAKAERAWVEERPAAQVGRAIADVAVGAPLMSVAGPVAATIPGGITLGAAYGYGTTPGGTAPREKEALLGAVGGALGGAVGKAVPYVGKAIKSVSAPFYEKGQEQIISRALRKAVGESAPYLAGKLENAVSYVPGSMPTAAEAAETSGGLAAIQRWAEQANPEEYAFRRMQNADARRAVLENIAGTPEKRAFFENLRTKVATPLYEQATSSSVPVDDTLRGLLSRPYVQEALNKGIRIAKNRNEYVGEITPAMLSDIVSGKVEADISGRALDLVKKGLDEMRTNPQSAMGKEEMGALKDTIKTFESWRETNMPEYAKAQKAYKRLTRPINQMDIGQALMEKLAPALTDYGPFTTERAATFAQALRNADATAQKATGFKGTRMETTLNPRQAQALEDVATDLSRKTQADVIGRGVGSNTFQNLAMQDLAEQTGFPGKVIGKIASRIPFANEVLSKATAEKDIKDRLAMALLDPKKTAQLLRITEPVEEAASYYKGVPAAIGTSLFRQ